jgi:hypothetical protein
MVEMNARTKPDEEIAARLAELQDDDQEADPDKLN